MEGEGLLFTLQLRKNYGRLLCENIVDNIFERKQASLQKGWKEIMNSVSIFQYAAFTTNQL